MLTEPRTTRPRAANSRSPSRAVGVRKTLRAVDRQRWSALGRRCSASPLRPGGPPSSFEGPARVNFVERVRHNGGIQTVSQVAFLPAQKRTEANLGRPPTVRRSPPRSLVRTPSGRKLRRNPARSAPFTEGCATCIAVSALAIPDYAVADPGMRATSLSSSGNATSTGSVDSIQAC